MSEKQKTAWTYHIGKDYTEFYDAEETLFMVHFQMKESLAGLIVSAPELKAERDLALKGYRKKEIELAEALSLLGTAAACLTGDPDGRETINEIEAFVTKISK